MAGCKSDIGGNLGFRDTHRPAVRMLLDEKVDLAETTSETGYFAVVKGWKLAFVERQGRPILLLGGCWCSQNVTFRQLAVR